jgi:hypothetical protein
MHYTRQRTQRSTFKRRKLFDRHAVLASEFGRANGQGNTKVTGRDSHASSLEGLLYFHTGISSLCYFLAFLLGSNNISTSAANKGTNSTPFQKSCASNDCHGKILLPQEKKLLSISGP